MDVVNIIQQHKKLCTLISEKRIKQSLDLLTDMLNLSSSGELRDEFENIVLTYRNMLTYTIDGVRDPARNKIYLKLIQSILKLADRVKQDILSHNSGWHTYWIKQQAEKEMKLSGRTIVETVDDLMFKSELDEWLKLSNEFNTDPESEISRKHRHLIRNIFNHLWITDYYGEAEKSLLDIMLRSDKPDVRTESVKALRPLAGPEQVPALVDLLVRSSDETARKEIGSTIAAAAKRKNRK